MSTLTNKERIGFLQNLVNYLALQPQSHGGVANSPAINFNCGVGGSATCPPSASCPTSEPCPTPNLVEISLQDRSTKDRFSRQDLEDIATACNILLKDFCKDWHFALHYVKVYNKDEKPNARFNAFFEDYSPVAFALGQHDFDIETGIGRAFSYVEIHMNYGTFANRALNDPTAMSFPDGIKRGTSAALTLLHEIYETMTNYYLNSFVHMNGDMNIYEISDLNTGDPVPIDNFLDLFNDAIGRGEKMYIRLEGANPVSHNIVEVDVNGKKIGLSDYVKPAWFNAAAKGPYNYLNTQKKAFEIDEGGYIDITLEGKRYFNSKPMIYNSST